MSADMHNINAACNLLVRNFLAVIVPELNIMYKIKAYAL